MPASELPSPTPPLGRKRLTFGMATYDDFDGVYFTVQAMRLSQPEVLDDVEILVVDNHPEGQAALALKSLERDIPNYRYVPFRSFRSPFVKDVVFREAGGDFVLCVDSHVLLAPGCLSRLFAYLDAHPGSGDLLQGPMFYDDLRSVVTHFEPVWRGAMFGTWATDARGVDPGAEPFEIPMQGLGLFGCYRSAWPGFNPRFRGFGGEEGYLHEKVRRAGGRTLCLPFLRWLHRFGRPLGVPYELTYTDRIRNYLIGWRELGLDPSEMFAHFRELLSEQEREGVLLEAQSDLDHPLAAFDAVYVVHWPDRPEARARMDGEIARLGIGRLVRHVEGTAAFPHREALVEAQKLGLRRVLVLEDDAALDPGAMHELVEAAFSGRPRDGVRVERGVRAGVVVAYHESAYARLLREGTAAGTEEGRTPCQSE